MKKIIFTRPDGGLSVVHPCEGARFATGVRLADGTFIERDDPAPVDTFSRGWPIDGAAVQWAESEEAFVGRIRAKDVPPDATDVQIVDESAIPADRTFRGAWVAGDGRVEHDMDKAREIRANMLRVDRVPLLKAADVEFFKGLEALIEKLPVSDEDKQPLREVIARKQALRDVTADPVLAKAETPDELKAAVPAVLRSDTP